MPGSEKQVDLSRLVEWVEGRLPEDEARDVEEQVARADSRTQADVAWLRKFVKAAEGAVLESPPQEVRDALITRFEAYAEGQRAPGFLERVLARLDFDSHLRPAVGLRAIGAQQARRQLIYSAEAFDVALNLRSPALGKNLDLEGQLFPREGKELEPFGVQLLQDGKEIALTATDELGSFALRHLQPGEYELVLCTDRLEISISPVFLSA